MLKLTNSRPRKRLFRLLTVRIQAEFTSIANKLIIISDDSWLEITPEELDQMLKERYGTDRNNFPQNSHPSQIPSQLNKFLEHMSGLDGVEFPG